MHGCRSRGHQDCRLRQTDLSQPVVTGPEPVISRSDGTTESDAIIAASRDGHDRLQAGHDGLNQGHDGLKQEAPPKSLILIAWGRARP
jgi:hypothetical protein